MSKEVLAGCSLLGEDDENEKNRISGGATKNPTRRVSSSMNDEWPEF